MKLDAIVAGGCAAVYAGTAAWAAYGSNFIPPFDIIVGVKDGLIAGICLAWMAAERSAGAGRARGIALVVSLIILLDALLALLALLGGAGPWRGDISANPSLTGGLVSGVFLIVIGVALVKFVRRPDSA
ncbi:MAG: hypothetical protein EXQ67_01240 [Thermoleophilia bacterium]|nr:hypothetical protein [Thermoleophilia bacterium]